MVFAFIILGTALMLSAVAAYYSIAGLTAIFAAAVLPVIIMGATLELGKVVATVWLHNNWKRINWIYKSYLVPAIVFLMLLTSMGIFGFLSKAHSDQSLVSGDAMSKVAIFDEKINTEKENIAQAKKAIEQMNSQVDQMLGRSDTERGAERAVSIRKNQAKERAELQAQINKSQKEIQKLQEERAPLAAEFRKVEAEVGPIKYIAALLYGDNPDQNVLERAVRWVIILIVVVFDPLALCLILAGNKQMEWVREDRIRKKLLENDEDVMHVPSTSLDDNKEVEEFFEKGILVAQALDAQEEKQRAEQANSAISEIVTEEPVTEKVEENLGDCPKCGTKLIDATGIGPFCPNKQCDVADSVNLYKEEGSGILKGITSAIEKDDTNQVVEQEELTEVDDPKSDVPESPKADDDSPPFEGVKDPTTGEWIQTGPTFPEEKKLKKELPYKKSDGDYVEYQGKSMHIDVLRSFNPELFLQEDEERATRTNFGTEFPNDSRTGDKFVRVDAIPNRVFKYNGSRWIEINRSNTDGYLTDNYLQFLVDKIATGEYDLDLLTQAEQTALEEYINKQG
jgi:hypothetical protein